MTLRELLADLDQACVRLTLSDGVLRFAAPKGAMTTARRAAIATHKDRIIELLTIGEAAPLAISSAADDRPAPLSATQARLWAVDRLAEPGAAAYTIVGAAQIKGPLDPGALERAFDAVVDRHAALVTVIAQDQGKPVQWADRANRPRLEHTDLSILPDSKHAADRVVNAIAETPLDPSAKPAVVARLLRLGPEHWIVAVAIHHVLADGWSIGLLLRDLGRAYGRTRRGLAPELPPAPSFHDHARRERSPEGEAVLERELAWWHSRLKDWPTVLDLPTDHPRPPVQSFAGAVLERELPPPLCRSIGRFAREAGTTAFIVLTTCFAALLARYAGVDRLLFGIGVSGRTRPDLNEVVGPFVNTLPLPFNFAGDPSGIDAISAVALTWREALAHQTVPFDRLVNALNVSRDGTRPPLVQVLITFQNVQGPGLELEGLIVRPLALRTSTSKIDLYLSIEQTTEGAYRLELEYATALFDRESISRLLAQYERMLACLTTAPAAPLLGHDLATAEDRPLRAALTGPAIDLPAAPLSVLVAERAAAAPDSIAVEAVRNVDGGAQIERLTYHELMAQAQSFTARLRAAGIEPGDVVAFELTRSLDTIVAILAILGVGAAYLPLDGDRSDPRRNMMVADAGARLLLAHAETSNQVASAPVPILRIDQPELDPAAAPLLSTRVADSLKSPPLAYVMYTSGSTGRPKGVAVSQRSVMRLARGVPFAGPEPPSRFLHLSPISFDASTFELWTPLLAGGTIVVGPPGPPAPDAIANTLEAGQVDTVWFTAGLFHALVDTIPDALARLAYVFAGGDVLSPSHCLRLLKRMRALGNLRGRLVNGYGPTETTTFACVHTMRPDAPPRGPIPLGLPIAGTQLHIVDSVGRPVPPSAPGELIIVGDGVAAGYVGQPELTAERFGESLSFGGRFYRSGDRVRQQADGALRFLGRFDRQLKLRGFRIEPGEIEAALMADPAVRSAVVVVRDDTGSRQLVAYVVPNDKDGINIDACAARLSGRIPAHMVPSAIVPLPALPLGRTGKVDQQALPPPPAAKAQGRAPSGPAEVNLAETWRSVLGVDQVDADANFFALGGDSILAIQVAARLAHQGWRLRVVELVRHQTFAAVAATLERATIEAASRESEAGPIPLSPIQRWFLERTLTGADHFNQAIWLRWPDRLSIDRVKRALSRLIERHEALRLRFVRHESGWSARLIESDRASPRVRAYGAADPAHVAADLQPSLDLERGPIVACGLRNNGTGTDLLLVIHHLAVDVVSWRLILDELAQLLADPTVDLGTKLGCWRGYVDALARLVAGSSGDAEAFASGPPPLRVDKGAEDEGVAPDPSAPISLVLELSSTRQLVDGLAPACRADLVDALAAALAEVAGQQLNIDHVRLDLEVHGRDLPGAEAPGIVGWCTGIVPLTLPTVAADPLTLVAMAAAARRQLPLEGRSWLALAYGAEDPEVRARARAVGPAVIALNHLGRVEGISIRPPLKTLDHPVGPTVGLSIPPAYPIEVTTRLEDGRLHLALIPDPTRVRRATAEALAANIEAFLGDLARATADRMRAALVPNALPRCPLDDPDLGRLLARLGSGTDGLHPARRIEAIWPLAPQQVGMLIESLTDPEGTCHLEQLTIRFDRPLDIRRLRAAWQAVIERHPALRTAFILADLKAPVQVVLNDKIAPVEAVEALVDPVHLEDLSAAERTAFDLARGETFRVRSLELTDGTGMMIWTFHHVLMDGWSMSLVLAELVQAYRDPDALAGPPRRGHALWLDWWRERDQGAEATFWHQALANLPPPMRLGRTDPGPSGSSRSWDGRSDRWTEIVRYLLDAGLQSRVLATAQRAGVPPNALVQSAFAAVVAGLERRSVTAFYATVAGRPPDVEGLEQEVGLFITALPRVIARPDCSIERHLAAVALDQAGAEAHPGISASQLAALAPRPGPLAEALLVFENYPRLFQAAPSDGPQILDVGTYGAHTRFPLTLLVTPGERWRLDLMLDRRRFAPNDGALVMAALEIALARLADTKSPPEAAWDAVLGHMTAGLATLYRRPFISRCQGDSVIDRVRVVWADVLGHDRFSDDSHFGDVGGHSLALVSIAAALNADSQRATTLAELAAAGTVRAQAALIRGSSGADGPRLLATLRPGGNDAPLVILPGASGWPYAYAPLTKALAPGRPVWAAAYPSPSDPAGSTPPALADRLASEIEGWAWRQPIHLLGHSFGAAVGVELARRMRRSGRPVGRLILLDQAAPGATSLTPLPDEAALAEEIARAAAAYFARPVTFPRSGSPAERLATALAEARILTTGGANAAALILDRYRSALIGLREWRPEAGPLAAVVIRCTDNPTTSTLADQDSTLGWGALLGHEVATAKVTGNHIDVLHGAAVTGLAAVLDHIMTSSPADRELG